jgi:hypothetical protein
MVEYHPVVDHVGFFFAFAKYPSNAIEDYAAESNAQRMWSAWQRRYRGN